MLPGHGGPLVFILCQHGHGLFVGEEAPSFPLDGASSCWYPHTAAGVGFATWRCRGGLGWEPNYQILNSESFNFFAPQCFIRFLTQNKCRSLVFQHCKWHLQGEARSQPSHTGGECRSFGQTPCVRLRQPQRPGRGGEQETQTRWKEQGFRWSYFHKLWSLCPDHQDQGKLENLNWMACEAHIWKMQSNYIWFVDTKHLLLHP